MKKNQASPSNTVDQLRQQFEQQNLQEQGATSPEPLYAQVKKSPKQQRPQGPAESAYASPRAPERAQEAAPPYPEERIYAPQKPLGNPYDRLPENPSNGQKATKLVDPYAIGDLSKLGSDPDFQQRNNPLYESVGEGAGGGRKPEENLYAELDWSPKGRSPTKPVESVYATVGGGAQGGRNPQSPEHLYAELEFGPNGGRSPTKPVESVYATVGGGATGGQAPQQQANPLYEGVGTGRTTPPPRTPQDQIRTKMMQNPEFQYTLLEVQERCQVVYGNRHALNEQLADILNNPQGGDKILWGLAENPESAGRLAGKVVLGVKSPARKEAENEFGNLCSTLEKHIQTAQKLHANLTREQERERGHSREASPEGHEHGHHRRHHRHHSPERGEHSPEQQTRGRQSPEQSKGGMAFAM
ncbi:BID domain-containing T4SS effector [Bartonella sp. ML70XJBT.G]|uniref:BID domain-containing T4SS effector n=1 Tax=Bartonella sp. ML70XJBT.G TaxID=3019093 RepID=UPI002361C81E|nr:BID domain-containing T4SS effector [Bartonella sp. ML70XJBT.G]